MGTPRAANLGGVTAEAGVVVEWRQGAAEDTAGNRRR